MLSKQGEAGEEFEIKKGHVDNPLFNSDDENLTIGAKGPINIKKQEKDDGFFKFHQVSSKKSILIETNKISETEDSTYTQISIPANLSEGVTIQLKNYSTEIQKKEIKKNVLRDEFNEKMMDSIDDSNFVCFDESHKRFLNKNGTWIFGEHAAEILMEKNNTNIRSIDVFNNRINNLIKEVEEKFEKDKNNIMNQILAIEKERERLNSNVYTCYDILDCFKVPKDTTEQICFDYERKEVLESYSYQYEYIDIRLRELTDKLNKLVNKTMERLMLIRDYSNSIENLIIKQGYVMNSTEVKFEELKLFKDDE